MPLAPVFIISASKGLSLKIIRNFTSAVHSESGLWSGIFKWCFALMKIRLSNYPGLKLIESENAIKILLAKLSETETS